MVEKSAHDRSHSSGCAVITGASSGIGRELAKQFAKRHYDLIVASESTDFDEAVSELRALGADVQPCRTDLRTPAVRSSKLRSNANSTSPDLNCRSVVHLAKRIVPKMVARVADACS